MDFMIKNSTIWNEEKVDIFQIRYFHIVRKCSFPHNYWAFGLHWRTKNTNPVSYFPFNNSERKSKITIRLLFKWFISHRQILSSLSEKQISRLPNRTKQRKRAILSWNQYEQVNSFMFFNLFQGQLNSSTIIHIFLIEIINQRCHINIIFSIF
jgi:hypothetical protein